MRLLEIFAGEGGGDIATLQGVRTENTGGRSANEMHPWAPRLPEFARLLAGSWQEVASHFPLLPLPFFALGRWDSKRTWLSATQKCGGLHSPRHSPLSVDKCPAPRGMPYS